MYKINPPVFTYRLNNHELVRIRVAKDRVVTFDSNVAFNTHMQEITPLTCSGLSCEAFEPSPLNLHRKLCFTIWLEYWALMFYSVHKIHMQIFSESFYYYKHFVFLYFASL